MLSDALMERNVGERVSRWLPRAPLGESSSNGRPAQLMQDMSKIIGVTNGRVWLAWHISY